MIIVVMAIKVKISQQIVIKVVKVANVDVLIIVVMFKENYIIMNAKNVVENFNNISN